MTVLQDHTLLVNGVQYHVQIAGEGPPLVLLHGFTGAVSNWHALADAFTERHTLVLVDLLGHGASDAPDDPARYAMPKAAADLVAVVQQVADGPVNLLGYSMGGRLALYVAMYHAQAVSKLVLESASPGMVLAEEQAARTASDNALAARIEGEGVSAFVDFWEGIPLFATQASLPPTVKAGLREQRLNNRAVGLANSLRGMGTGVQPSLWAGLDKLPMPSLLITGELDEKFTRIGEQMAGQMSQVQHIQVPDAGHTVHLEQPDAFVRSVVEFLG